MLFARFSWCSARGITSRSPLVHSSHWPVAEVVKPTSKRPQRPPQEHFVLLPSASSGAPAARSLSASPTTASGARFTSLRSYAHSGRILKTIGCTQSGQGTRAALLNPDGSTKGSRASSAGSGNSSPNVQKSWEAKHRSKHILTDIEGH